MQTRIRYLTLSLFCHRVIDAMIDLVEKDCHQHRNNAETLLTNFIEMYRKPPDYESALAINGLNLYGEVLLPQEMAKLIDLLDTPEPEPIKVTAEVVVDMLSKLSAVCLCYYDRNYCPPPMGWVKNAMTKGEQAIPHSEVTGDAKTNEHDHI